MEKNEKLTENYWKSCKERAASTSDHVDEITLHYKEDIIDLKQLSGNFARELERMNILFRELQTEFMVTLEEKRTHNETLLKGMDMKEKQIDRAKEKGKGISKNSLEQLLPKLKRSHELSNQQLSQR